MAESTILMVLCIKECNNADFINEKGLYFRPFKFIPGEKYLYYDCEKKKYNYIYRRGSDYHGCVTKDFINQNFIPTADYENTVKEIDSLFEKTFYEKGGI